MEREPDFIKASDLVIKKLVEAGVDTFFGVTGGAAVHFFDSVDKNSDAKSIFLNHEQSASFAMEAYAKTRVGLGAGIFTTGPGATNAITGLAAAWLDSTPCVFISGQSRVNSTINGRNIRQVGTQEIDIVNIVKPITKYAVTVRNINELSYHIDCAIFLSQEGRKGPCWIDIPVDISWSEVHLKKQRNFSPPKKKSIQRKIHDLKIFEDLLLNQLFNFKRPIVIIGRGVRSAGIEKELLSILQKLNLHFVSTWAMADFCETDNANYLGQLGISGQRGGNIAVQNADILICFGTHLNNSITGTQYDLFAPDAKIVVISNDKDELNAINVKTAHCLCLDLLDIMPVLSACNIDERASYTSDDWSEYCAAYKTLNNFTGKFSGDNKFISSYYLKDIVSRSASKDAIFVTDGGGTNVYSSHQSINITGNQRMLLSAGLCSMGSGLPEAIGAYFASDHKPIICFIGDGSFPFNVQELQVIANLNLDIKVFVLNNSGYSSIKTTQQDFLNSNYIGSDVGMDINNVHTLNICNIAHAFKIPYERISLNKELHENLDYLTKSSGPIICECMIDPAEIVEPRQGFRSDGRGGFTPQPLYDMYPFLTQGELSKLKVQDSD
jgi:acetolactate synthase-1/2/3 large subunit